jgi:hypothetical protein
MSVAMEDASPLADQLGVTGVVVGPLERVPVRTRESAVIGSAWRLGITCDQGVGAIVLVDLSGGTSLFRGDGVFLGWPQARLGEAYRLWTGSLAALEPDLELLQLG